MENYKSSKISYLVIRYLNENLKDEYNFCEHVCGFHIHYGTAVVQNLRYGLYYRENPLLLRGLSHDNILDKSKCQVSDIARVTHF